jgi:exonuclease SbcC
MKILNLKFKNINSLAGEWKIDFSEPQFTDNGLFAITGKTGSGKSSILDAISLALYGKTPRVDVTGKNNDVMTRGTKDCFAEITFKTDGERWTSTWKQERMRTGALKQVERSIADEKGNIVADKNSECGKKIIEILGLTFEQFTKVVMLAQGSFAAFLQADKNDKGELLEQITGTEIYGEISKKVFERNKAEVQKLEKINFELGAIKIFSEEEIEIHNNEISKLEENKKLIDRELQTIDTAKKWLADLENLQKQIAESTTKLPELEAKVTEAKTALQIAENELKTAKDEQHKAAPVFVKVRELDTKISEKEKVIKPILETLKSIENERNNLAAKREQQQQKLKQLQENLQKKTHWKQNNLKYESLVGKYAAIENQNAQVFDLQKDLLAKQQNFTKAVSDLSNKSIALQKVLSHFESKQQLLAQKTAELNAQKKVLAEMLGGKDLSFLQNEKEALTKKGLNIKSLIDNLKVIISENKNRENYDKQIADNSQKDKELENKTAVDTETIKNLKTQIGLLQENIDLAKTIQSLEEHRKSLEDGKPCPLCGAISHPYAAGNIPQTGENQQQLNDLKKQCETLEKSVQQNEQQRVALTANSKNASNNKIAAEANLKGNREKNNQILLETPDLNYEETEECVTKLEELRTTKVEEYQNLTKIITDAENVVRKIKNLQDTDIPQIQQQERAAETAKTDTTTAQLLALKVKETAENLANEANTQFETANSALQKTLVEYGVTTIENLKKCLDAWNEDTTAITKLTEQETQLKNDIQINNNSITNQQKNFDERTKEKSTLEVEKQNIDNERKALFGDKKAEDEEQQLKNSVDTREKAKIAAEQNKNTATQILAEAKAIILQNQANLNVKSDEKLTEKTVEELQLEQDEKKPQADELSQKIGAIRQALTSNAENLKKNSNKLKEKEQQQQICTKWGSLNELIGSGDGKKYRNFAQALTFEHLIGLANRQLQKMSERYILKRVGDAVNPFELSVIDKIQNCDERTAKNLSGGEKFIVSLSLALGLANMASKNMKIDTMFIDEGFGTLDTDYLDVALTALSNLQNEGKLIGVISHLAELQERIATHIEVIPKGNGYSRIEIRN